VSNFDVAPAMHVTDTGTVGMPQFLKEITVFSTFQNMVPVHLHFKFCKFYKADRMSALSDRFT
jgi:hypothetical protein